MIHRAVLSLTFWIATAACSQETDPLQRWIGRDVSMLVQVWGEPTQETSYLDGRAMIYTSYWQDGYSDHRCQRTFGVNARDIIISLSSSGC